MLDEVVALREGAFAELTLIRLLARMDAVVPFQVVFAVEPATGIHNFLFQLVRLEATVTL